MFNFVNYKKGTFHTQGACVYKNWENCIKFLRKKVSILLLLNTRDFFVRTTMERLSFNKFGRMQSLTNNLCLIFCRAIRTNGGYGATP